MDFYSTPSIRVDYCDERVCGVCMSVLKHILGTTRSNFTKFSVF